MLMNPGKSAADYCGEIAQVLREQPNIWTRGTLKAWSSEFSHYQHCAVGLVEQFVPEALRAEAVGLVAAAVWPASQLRHKGYGEVRALLEHWNDLVAKGGVEDVTAAFEIAARLSADELRQKLNWASPASWNAVQQEYLGVLPGAIFQKAIHSALLSASAKLAAEKVEHAVV